MNIFEKLKKEVAKRIPKRKENPDRTVWNETLKTMLTNYSNNVAKNTPAYIKDMPESIGGMYIGGADDRILLNKKYTEMGGYGQEEVWPHELAHKLFDNRRRAGHLFAETMDRKSPPAFGRGRSDRYMARGQLDNDAMFMNALRKNDPNYANETARELGASSVYDDYLDLPSELYAYQYKNARNQGLRNLQEMTRAGLASGKGERWDTIRPPYRKQQVPAEMLRWYE